MRSSRRRSATMAGTVRTPRRRRRRRSAGPDDRCTAKGEWRCGRGSFRSAAWNWFILAAVLLFLESARSRRLHAVARDSPPSWSAPFRSASIWSWQTQVIAFAVFAVALIPAWRNFARKVEPPSRQSVPQSPRGRLCRARVHARQADRQRRRHHSDRRYDLAGDGSGLSGGQPGQDRHAPTAPTWRLNRRSVPTANPDDA